MRTAVSVPDRVFNEAERLARRLGIGRSQLYAKAVWAYVRRHRDTGVTKRLNDIYGKEDSILDPALARMQSHSMPREDWE